MLGGTVANRSTTTFEPHSKEESFTAYEYFSGRAGIRRTEGRGGKIPPSLWYGMHDGLGCITGLSIYFLLVIIWSDVSEACYSFVDHY